ncbi:hypothetical protein BRADI_3g19107v3 [Brachypodium distachyon]|uniref:Uncharacterized protein n=1 Tax=Brachypodium distachyon TaxID=15368 RepID=A0A2K2CY80_BRADI|nr:hypothetical protein BRADI_3g19107v3 [Brachypodium distachyon]
MGCSLTRQVWFELLYGWGCQDWMPAHDDALIDWWSDRPTAGKDRKSLATSVTLILWSIWKHQNKVDFDKEAPCLSKLLSSLRKERWVISSTAGFLRGAERFFTGNKEQNLESIQAKKLLFFADRISKVEGSWAGR